MGLTLRGDGGDAVAQDLFLVGNASPGKVLLQKEDLTPGNERSDEEEVL
jgi:hypothetical protein